MPKQQHYLLQSSNSSSDRGGSSRQSRQADSESPHFCSALIREKSLVLGRIHFWNASISNGEDNVSMPTIALQRDCEEQGINDRTV